MSESFLRKKKTASDTVVMEAKGINKVFPGVKALTDVDIKIHKGEVVALLGENGAGKSTLIKILSGVYQAESGIIQMHGTEVKFATPLDAKQAGIGVVHQELNYVSAVSIAENIFMGNIPRKYGLVDYRTMYQEATRIMKLVGLELAPQKPIGSCSVAQKQLIEIAKNMSNNIQVLILDEPTSSLNDLETEYLFRLIEKAAENGISIFYISHKLDELFKIADRVVVLRDGCVTGEVLIENATKQELIARMVGRDLSDMYPKEKVDIGDEVISVKNLRTENLNDISFWAKAGEIFGIYGLMGSGHQNIGAALFGYEPMLEGSISVRGTEVKITTPIEAINCGLTYVPAERKVEGLVLNQTVATNTMSTYYSKQKKWLVNRKREQTVSEKWVKAMATKTPSVNTQVEYLSGGNQQKVVLSKWLELNPDVLILNEPTRGIDVGAKAEIYRILNKLCKEGKCIIMITSEMPELLAMSDRIMVMFEGKVTGTFSAEEASQELIVKCAIGGLENE